MTGQRDIVIDITRLANRIGDGLLPTGVDRVSLEYIRHFGGRALALVRVGARWHFLTPADSARVFAATLAPTPRYRQGVRRALVRAAVSRRPPFGDRPFFLFNTGHSGLEQSGYARQLQRYPLRPLFFLHDIIPVTYPEYCRPQEGARHRVRLDTALQLGAGIITNSAVTLDELQRYAASAGITFPPAAVASLAPPVLPAPGRPLLAQPYFLMIGTIEPRKNHTLLLQLWRRLVQTHGDRAPHLVIVGRRGWECENVVDLLERCEQLRGFVHERADCDDGELATWLGHARALLFPSFAEGYGLPLVEALLARTPVVASDLPAFREIAGVVPEYLDPLDGPAWQVAIEDYMQPDSTRRAAQLVRLRRFVPSTWSDHFRAVEALMARLG